MKTAGTAAHLFLSVLQLFVSSPILDSIANFVLLSLYSTMTIREHILIVNGSHIRFWWVVHHYLCVAIAGTMLIWPGGQYYQEIRTTLTCFAIYIAAVQILQYRYQIGRLYTLRALARVDPMETTTDAENLHLSTDLYILLPFLFIGHVSIKNV